MMNRILLIGALLLLGPTASAFQNEPDGFHGIKWGTPFSANAREMTLKEKVKDETYYTRRSDQLSLAGAKVSEIAYGYWNDRLTGVIVEVSGAENKSALIDAFRRQYGPGTQPKEFVDEYRWRGDITNINLNCTRMHCFAFLYSTRLSAEQRKQKKN